MISFYPFKTKRITASFKELTIGQSIELAGFDSSVNELITSKLLSYVVAETTLDLSDWTVQERMLAVAHYLSHTLEEEGGDFRIGDGKLSDYVQTAKDYCGVLKLNGHSQWLHPVTAKIAEAIETLSSNRKDWYMRTMAVSIRTEEFDTLQMASDSEITEFINQSYSELINLPESVFSELLLEYEAVRSKAVQFFNLSFDDSGFTVMPIEQGGVNDLLLSPTRFSAYECIGEIAKNLCG